MIFSVASSIELDCPSDMVPHLQQVLSGEYDIPLYYPSDRYPMILDLGANCGAFSLWAKRRWPHCFITAYEPHPTNFTYLRDNTAKWSNIACLNEAVGKPGLRPFYDGKYNGGEASLYAITNNLTPTGRHIEVMSPLELPPADIIKLDVEGAEMEILEPLILDGRKFDAVLLEWHSHDLRKQIDTLLEDYNLIKSEVYHSLGRGLSCYMHKELLR